MRKLVLELGVIACMLASVPASPHARLRPTQNILVPRNDNAGIKTGPCGGVPRRTPVVLEAGSTIQVNWQETVNHPGRFEFYFSPANDQNFTLIKTVNDDRNRTDDLPHEFSTSLTLPNVPCDLCTIQMIQVMTENPARPSLYFSCSDITLRPSANPPPPPPEENCVK